LFRCRCLFAIARYFIAPLRHAPLFAALMRARPLRHAFITYHAFAAAML